MDSVQNIKNNDKFLNKAIRGIYDTAYQKPVTFGVTWIILFAVLLVSANFLGLVPSLNSELGTKVVLADDVINSEIPMSIDDTPVRIIIDSVGVDSIILNPQSRDINVLNESLLDGVVHYPGSGDLDENTNLFLFGHSTRIPLVQNDNYKVFSKLDDLSEGDVIRIQSVDKEYRYRVSKVELVNANDAWVEFKTGKKQLTLSTCDVFGKKQDRYVIESDYIGSFLISNNA